MQFSYQTCIGEPAIVYRIFADSLSIGPVGTNFFGIYIYMQFLFFMQMYFLDSVPEIAILSISRVNAESAFLWEVKQYHH